MRHAVTGRRGLEFCQVPRSCVWPSRRSRWNG